MAEIGERVAVLEDWRRGAQGEIASLRETRHKHADAIQALTLRAEVAAEELEVMSERVVPEIRDTLRQHAADIRQIRESTREQKTDHAWLKTTLAWVLQVAQALMLLGIAYALKG